jgi:hypothetical protein
MSKKTIISFTYFIILLLALLYPYSYRHPFKDVPNGLKRVPGAVEFDRGGVLTSADLPKEFFHEIAAASGMTLEIWMIPKSRKSNQGMAIVSCLSPVRWNPTLFRSNFAVYKADSYLNIDLRYRTNNKNVIREFHIGDVFVEGLHHIVATYDRLHLSVYVNGKKHYESQEITGVLDNWYRSAFLVIGNNAIGRAPYKGNLLEIGLYKRSMSEDEIREKYHAYRNGSDKEYGRQREKDDLLVLYDFDMQRGSEFKSLSGTLSNMNLVIPDRFRVWRKLFLSLPYYIFSFSYTNIIDTVLNIVAFIPFGFILQMRASQRYNPWFAANGILLFGLFCLLVVEIAQFFIESRYSTLTDVIHNCIGVFVGICICMTATRYGKKLHGAR